MLLQDLDQVIQERGRVLSIQVCQNVGRIMSQRLRQRLIYLNVFATVTHVYGDVEQLGRDLLVVYSVEAQ